MPTKIFKRCLLEQVQQEVQGVEEETTSAQFSGNNNLTQKNKDALSAQRKGARAAITPSTTMAAKIKLQG